MPGVAACLPVVHGHLAGIPSPVYSTESRRFSGADLRPVRAADMLSQYHLSRAGVHRACARLWKVGLVHEALHPGHASC